MATIVPAILETTMDGFLDKVAVLTKIPDATRIQIDFADGKFVPNTTVSVHDMDPLNPAFTWEAHLMIEEPVDFLDYQIAGFQILVVHYEGFKDKSQINSALESIRKLGMKAGLAINPETPVSTFRPHLEMADQLLLLSVVPGFQGNPFVEQTYDRVRELRELAPRGILEVDGGIKIHNIQPLQDAGADLLVVGSALFETENVQENFDLLTKEITI